MVSLCFSVKKSSFLDRKRSQDTVHRPSEPDQIFAVYFMPRDSPAGMRFRFFAEELERGNRLQGILPLEDVILYGQTSLLVIAHFQMEESNGPVNIHKALERLACAFEALASAHSRGITINAWPRRDFLRHETSFICSYAFWYLTAYTILPRWIWRTRAKFRYRHRLCGRCLYVAADFVEDASSRTDISDVCTWKMPFCTHAKCPDYGNFSCRSSETRLLFTHMPFTRHARVHLLIASIFFLESCISPAIAGWQIAHLSKLKRIDPQHVAHL